MSVDSKGQMSVDRMSVDRMSVDRMSVDSDTLPETIDINGETINISDFYDKNKCLIYEIGKNKIEDLLISYLYDKENILKLNQFDVITHKILNKACPQLVKDILIAIEFVKKDTVATLEKDLIIKRNVPVIFSNALKLIKAAKSARTKARADKAARAAAEVEVKAARAEVEAKAARAEAEANNKCLLATHDYMISRRDFETSCPRGEILKLQPKFKSASLMQYSLMPNDTIKDVGVSTYKNTDTITVSSDSPDVVAPNVVAPNFSSPPRTNLFRPITPNVGGGNLNKSFYKQYLKYKFKYIILKNKLK